MKLLISPSDRKLATLVEYANVRNTTMEFL